MTDVTRRDALKLLAATGGVAVGCSRKSEPTSQPGEFVSANPVVRVQRLPQGEPWPVPDPFLFCVHHDDKYPRGNASFGPDASLEGRRIGQDFERKDGWNMYHGRTVPGFPAHPHRGFETVTVVRRGLLDHADSLGAAARYGEGDVQWLTAGAGIQHAEMFPLLSQNADNHLELFQIWLNLPRDDKMAAPHFKMLWAPTIPRISVADAAGRVTEVTLSAGELNGVRPPAPPPHSWAARPENEVAIWTARLEAGAHFTLPKASPGVGRMLYFFRGSELRVAGTRVEVARAVELHADRPTSIENGAEEGEFLLLQGRAIGETVARRGPFVMNTNAEIREAYLDYQATQFGGWPWDSEAPVHGPEARRFARRPDGSVETPS